MKLKLLLFQIGFEVCAIFLEKKNYFKKNQVFGMLHSSKGQHEINSLFGLRLSFHVRATFSIFERRHNFHPFLLGHVPLKSDFPSWEGFPQSKGRIETDFPYRKYKNDGDLQADVE